MGNKEKEDKRKQIRERSKKEVLEEDGGKGSEK